MPQRYPRLRVGQIRTLWHHTRFGGGPAAPTVCRRVRRFQRLSQRWPEARMTPGRHGPYAPGIATTPAPSRVEVRGNRAVSPNEKRGAARPRPLFPSRPPSKHTATAEKIPIRGMHAGLIRHYNTRREAGTPPESPSQDRRPGFFLPRSWLAIRSRGPCAPPSRSIAAEPPAFILQFLVGKMYPSAPAALGSYPFRSSATLLWPHRRTDGSPRRV